MILYPQMSGRATNVTRDMNDLYLIEHGVDDATVAPCGS